MRLLSLLLCLVAISGCASHPARDRGGDTLILVSIDGFRSDYLQRGHTPTLAALAHDGVRAEWLQPAFPTLTFPAHYTLVTGLHPDHHGIVNNRMTDPASGKRFVYKERASASDSAWWGGEPLWVTAERQGVRTATMFWPGSDVEIARTRPGHWLPFDGDMTPTARVDRILQWLDLPPAQRPRFLTLYFEQVDHAGHRHGPDAPEVAAALRVVDDALARLVDGLGERGLARTTNLVVVSDHGSAATRPELRTVLDDLIPLEHVTVVNYGVLAGIEPLPGHAASIERALLAPHPRMQCWRKAEFPARFHYGSHPRIPSLLCLAANGGVITSRAYAEGGGHFSAGEHGYDNEDPQMRALFVARGPAFRRGAVVPAFAGVDVYPLLAHVLGLEPASNDGDFDAVAPALREPPRAGTTRTAASR